MIKLCLKVAVCWIAGIGVAIAIAVIFPLSGNWQFILGAFFGFVGVQLGLWWGLRD